MKDLDFEALWVARDEDGSLYVYSGKPGRLDNVFWPCHTDGDDGEETTCASLPAGFYPEVTWENSPVLLQAVVGEGKEGAV